jgi:hypothetical protein
MVDAVLKVYGERIIKKLAEDIRNKPLPRRGGKSYVANASGDLADTLRYEVSNGKLLVYANHYIYQLVFGRKPGKRPPREVIVQWIKDKGIQSDIPIQSLAFLIQRSIGKTGTLLYPSGSTLISDIINDALINDLSSDLFSEIVDSAVTSFHQLKQAA